MRKRIVYRGSDVGYTRISDEGFFKAVDEGIVTSADIMLDMPDSVSALTRLSERPWISVGWHCRHFWGAPVAGADKVPNMVNPDGMFKFRRDQKLINEITYEDAYTEYKAELEMFISIMGKVPDTTEAFGDYPVDAALRDLCEEYGIVYNCCGERNPKTKIYRPAREEYRHLKYEQPDAIFRKGEFDLAYFKENYNLMNVLTKLSWEDDEIWRIGGHPGFLDDTILNESSCNIHRVKDVADAISDETKQYLIDNHIELVNQHDVIWGTSEYQDHLRDTGSPLWAGNWS